MDNEKGFTCGHGTSTEICNVTAVLREFDGSLRRRRRSAIFVCYKYGENE